jgi:hypothetical protein
VNPLTVWKRSDAVRHGFESVRRTLLDNAEILGPLFEAYGLELRPVEAPETPEEADLNADEEVSGRRKRMRLVGSR